MTLDSGSLKDSSARIIGPTLKGLFRQKASIDGASPKSIAIIKPCCLGDVLMATSILRPLREAYPGAKLTFIVGDWSREVVANNPHIDQVLNCGQVGSGSKYSWDEYYSIVKRLRSGKFDWCIVLERSVWIALIPLLAGVPVRAGLDSEGRGFSLNVRTSCDGIKHEAQRYLDCIQALGVAAESPRLEFHPTADDKERARTLLRGFIRDGPLVAIHPGGGANPGMVLSNKRWDPEGFGAVANLLVEKYGATILLLGTADEAALSEQVRRTMTAPALDLTGKTSLGEMGAVLELCQLFVGNDTGPMHLATAVGTPVVALFGPSDPRVYGPFSPKATVVSASTSCSPCFVRGKAPECKVAHCMREISVEQVWKAVQQQL